MKDLLLKIYDTSDNILYITTEFNFTSITETLRGGLGSVQIQLPEQFDFGNTSESFNFFNKIKIIEVSENNPSGFVSFSGFIGEKNPVINENTEYLGLICYGYVSYLSKSVLYSGTNSYVSYSSTEASVAVNNVISNYNSNYENIFTTDLDVTSVTETFGFDSKSHYDALNTILDQSPVNWYWRLSSNNVLEYKQFNSTPDHYLTIGKNCVNIQYEESAIDIFNDLFFDNGDTIYKRFSDATSISTYKRLSSVKKDTRFNNSGSANRYGDRFINANKDPIKSLRFAVFDSSYDSSGYDVTLIKPGDTCKFLNVGVDSGLPDNGIITDTRYDMGIKEIVVEDRASYISKRIQELSSRIQYDNFGGKTTRTFTT